MRPGFSCYCIATWTATIALYSGFATVALAQDAQKPNILFIVSDDTGYGDLGPYGGGEGRGAACRPPASTSWRLTA
jgi:hypothetical protein